MRPRSRQLPGADKAAAVVLGGYVNGYSIIRELRACGVPCIWLIDVRRSIASRSNQLDGFSLIQDDAVSLQEELVRLARQLGQLVLFPTSDRHLELLHEVREVLADTCFLPFRSETLLESLDKGIQYAHCQRLGVPFPRTAEIETCEDLARLDGLTFPVLLKPAKRDDLTSDVFRNLLLETKDTLDAQRRRITAHVECGVKFLASELVPGDDTVIYAYTAYRSPTGRILNEWIGKKLNQYPDKFGVFSSASNEAPDVVLELGRKLVEGMDLVGIVEPEFKYDARDGTFKVMEVNLRSMMWHRMGSLSGVSLQFTQWCDAMGDAPRAQMQERQRRIHFVYMKHEIINLLSRRGYWPYFARNVFGGEERHFAVFNWRDPMPAIADLITYPRALLSTWLKRLGMR